MDKGIEHTNQYESRIFWRTAFAWQGSVTPIVLPRLAMMLLYAVFVSALISVHEEFWLALTPFEYSGVILGLLLVLRVNAGIDRWWEARKIWGSIVNQSRNLAIICSYYIPPTAALKVDLLKWITIWPYAMKESLRGGKDLPYFEGSADDIEREDGLLDAAHMPTYVGAMIASLLYRAKEEGLDGFSFMRADQERSLLIDAIGACERILKTPMPYVLAVKARRFIVLFLALLPFGLYEKIGWITPFVTVLVAYPLLSLDEIGLQLQNPFSKKNLSHLPLDDICQTIERNIKSLPMEIPEGPFYPSGKELIRRDRSGQAKEGATKRDRFL